MELNQNLINTAIKTSLIKSLVATHEAKDKDSISLTFILVLNDKKITNFIQSVDIFSKSKCCVSVEIYNTPVFNISNLNGVIKVLVDTFNNDTTELVLAIPLKIPEYSYINKQYRQLSDGTRTMTVHNFLNVFNVPHETDSNLFIL